MWTDASVMDGVHWSVTGDQNDGNNDCGSMSLEGEVIMEKCDLVRGFVCQHGK